VTNTNIAGNIFVLDDGRVGLIDFGQVKQISGRVRETLCHVMIALDERKAGEKPDVELVGKLALDLGVGLKPTAKPEAAAAVGIWLFDGSVTELPGGYDLGELSPNSPVKELKSFGQDLVLVGRASILIKGLASRLDVPWSLAREWAPIARQVLSNSYEPSNAGSESRVRFRDVYGTFSRWCKGRATQVARRLPSPIRTFAARLVLRIQERKARRNLTKRQ